LRNASVFDGKVRIPRETGYGFRQHPFRIVGQPTLDQRFRGLKEVLRIAAGLFFDKFRLDDEGHDLGRFAHSAALSSKAVSW
jgi:hypothetical protein